jgi:hypothetical protein
MKKKFKEFTTSILHLPALCCSISLSSEANLESGEEKKGGSW